MFLLTTLPRKEPLTSWNPEIVQLRWQVRWTQKGLMPVKPVLHLTGSLALPAGHACRCSAAPGAAPQADA